MTKHSYHPVGLAILRGSLQASGFTVKRIRCIIPANDYQSWAAYKISVTGLTTTDTGNWTPNAVFDAALGSFSGDVHIEQVQYIQGWWVLTVRTELGERSRPYLPGMAGDHAE